MIQRYLRLLQDEATTIMLKRNPEHDEDDDRSGANMIVLIVVAIIIAIGIVVVWQMKKESNLEDCYAAGHRNCAPVDAQDSQ